MCVVCYVLSHLLCVCVITCVVCYVLSLVLCVMCYINGFFYYIHELLYNKETILLLS